MSVLLRIPHSQRKPVPRRVHDQGEITKRICGSYQLIVCDIEREVNQHPRRGAIRPTIQLEQVLKGWKAGYVDEVGVGVEDGDGVRCTGVRIHRGNTDKHTHGCLLPGTTKSEDFVGNSRSAFKEVMDLIEDAINLDEEITIEYLNLSSAGRILSGEIPVL